MRLENRALVNYIKFYFKKIRMSQGWWLKPVIPALHRLRQTNYCKYITRRAWIHQEFQASLGYSVKACLKTNNNIKKQNARVKT